MVPSVAEVRLKVPPNRVSAMTRPDTPTRSLRSQDRLIRSLRSPGSAPGALLQPRHGVLRLPLVPDFQIQAGDTERSFLAGTGDRLVPADLLPGPGQPVPQLPVD